MNHNVHFPDPSQPGQPPQFHPRREDIIQQYPQLPPPGFFYQPQPYPQVREVQRPNYPSLTGPYGQPFPQQAGGFAPEAHAVGSNQRVASEPRIPEYPRQDNLAPIVIQQGVVYQPSSDNVPLIQYPTFNNSPNYHYSQVPHHDTSFNNDPYKYYNANHIIVPANSQQVMNPDIQIQQLEAKIKSRGCYEVLQILSMLMWAFGVSMTFIGRAKGVFKVLEIVLALVFLTGLILNKRAKARLNARKQFYAFLIFTLMIFAQLAVSILTVISLGKRMGKYHRGYGGYQGSNGYNNYGGYNGYNGQGYGGYNQYGYGGYNGYDRNYGCHKSVLTICLIAFMIVLPFIFNVLMSCYARNRSKLMRERQCLLHNFRPLNRVI